MKLGSSTKFKHHPFQEQFELSKQEGETVAYVVDPNQGPSACDPGKKGIYLQISETFPEEFSGQVSSSVTFQTPFEGAENQSGFYTSREEVFGNTKTGSLVQLLGFDDTAGTSPRPVGKIASSKAISEAIVMIPYFEESFAVHGMQNVGVPNYWTEGGGQGGEIEETVRRQILSTIQIIPGYHFLRIDKQFFENALGVMLVDRLTTPGTPRNTQLKNAYKNYNAAKDLIEKTDLGQLIKTLSGENSAAKLGYMLPPEMDFMNNSAITPFQMSVIPIDHKLDKVDLSNIWQNLAPDATFKASKTTSEVVLRPGETSIAYNLDSIHDLLGPGIVFPDAFVTSNQGQFLCAKSLSATFGSWGDDRIKYYGSYPKSPAEFYGKLRWMVFKVKQRSAMNYDLYKKRQVDLALANNGVQRYQTGDSQYVTLDSLTTQELYGANWPYDYFSLIERAKIEVEYGVTS